MSLDSIAIGGSRDDWTLLELLSLNLLLGIQSPIFRDFGHDGNECVKTTSSEICKGY